MSFHPVPLVVSALSLLLALGNCHSKGNGSDTSPQDTMHAHTNRLVHETSPYLLQHAHNPVDWYPWGDEAFAKAKADNKLVLVSIGYSSCHWCHVMERECFENDSIAALMNERFVCIKVDREERPDVDQVYMAAVQLMTGRGGWPLNCFTLPDGRPVYGGTYFPPAQWTQVLADLNTTWQREPQRKVTVCRRDCTKGWWPRTWCMPNEHRRLRPEHALAMVDRLGQHLRPHARRTGPRRPSSRCPTTTSSCCARPGSPTTVN